MQLLIDNVLAVIIGGVILFVLAAVNLRTQEGSIAAVQVDATKSSIALLANMMDQDFSNMGSGMHDPNDSPASSVITFFGTVGGYEKLIFTSLPAYPAGSVGVEPSVIEYRWKVESQVVLADNSVVDAYRVERLIDNVVSGSSLDNITAISIQVLDANRTIVSSANLHSGRYIDVDITAVSPLGPEGLLEEARWVKQYRPLNLDREGRDRLRIVLPSV